MKPHPKLIRTIASENNKLSAKELATATYITNGMGVKLTIGDLTMDQLRVCLFLSLKDQRMIEKNIVKAFAALADIQPAI